MGVLSITPWSCVVTEVQTDAFLTSGSLDAPIALSRKERFVFVHQLQGLVKSLVGRGVVAKTKSAAPAGNPNSCRPPSQQSLYWPSYIKQANVVAVSVSYTWVSWNTFITLHAGLCSLAGPHCTHYGCWGLVKSIHRSYLAIMLMFVVCVTTDHAPVIMKCCILSALSCRGRSMVFGFSVRFQ
jgi:hypothetical protein